ncbi:MAG: A/G-specific adenine glycosylase [Gammaproteobacteria bacterium]|nr:A/G-specific adenine glycosylase [Gammaproteobacteria bacterium]
MSRDGFSTRLLTWYDRHGRKTLPWKRVRDPYLIWVSEIMLQQTQVATVIPYFERFIKRFPDIRTLARARPDSVLHLWSGLGYYARARNLHQAARQIVTDHGGTFPHDIERVVRLPGIGRSTAGAILALAFDQRHAILDGNVKRVLARYHAIRVPLNQQETEDRLWRLAGHHTPHRRVADYTQAIMDLGATVCTRVNPDCVQCPVRAGCKARKLGMPQNFPVIAKRNTLPVKKVNMLLIRDTRNRVLLVKRPPAGLWGGLWGLPECTQKNVRAWCQAHIGLDIRPQKVWPMFRHSFSHFHLDITPISARATGLCERAMENGDSVWYNVTRPDARGLAAPVQKLLQRLENT